MAFLAILIWWGPPLFIWWLFGDAGVPFALSWFWFFAFINFFAQRGRPEAVAYRQAKSQQRREARANRHGNIDQHLESPATTSSELEDDDGFGPSGFNDETQDESESEPNPLSKIKFCGQCGVNFDNETDQYCGWCGSPRALT